MVDKDKKEDYRNRNTQLKDYIASLPERNDGYVKATPSLIQDNGLTGSHYELPEGATELKHLIWFKNMNAQIGEAFRSLYRLDNCAHSTRRRDLNKVLAYINQEIERMDIYGEP